MGVAELEEALRRQAAERAQSLVEEARHQTAEAREASDRSWEKRRVEALAEAEADTRAQTATELTGARRAARRRVLEARRDAIDRVLEAIRARLDDGSVKRRVVGDDLPELLAYLPSPDVVVHERPDGLVITSKDGSMTVDATLGRMLERLRPQISIRVLGLIDREAT